MKSYLLHIALLTLFVNAFGVTAEPSPDKSDDPFGAVGVTKPSLDKADAPFGVAGFNTRENARTPEQTATTPRGKLLAKIEVAKQEKQKREQMLIEAQTHLAVSKATYEKIKLDRANAEVKYKHIQDELQKAKKIDLDKLNKLSNETLAELLKLQKDEDSARNYAYYTKYSATINLAKATKDLKELEDELKKLTGDK